MWGTGQFSIIKGFGEYIVSIGITLDGDVYVLNLGHTSSEYSLLWCGRPLTRRTSAWFRVNGEWDAKSSGRGGVGREISLISLDREKFTEVVGA